jgi:CYTH domain-containing protein
MAKRRFLMASSLARLVRKESGVTERIVEGYFPPRPDLEHFVRIESGQSYLVLAPTRDGSLEDRTEVPRSQAEALLSICAGKVGFESTGVRLQGGNQARLQRFLVPEPLDLISVEFLEGEDADGFDPPVWFGPEVTQNPAYDRGSLARAGMPAMPDITLSNLMLDELLDVLEEGAIAAELGRAPSFKVVKDRSAERQGEGGVSAEPPGRSVESTHEAGLMAGLAEALKGVELTTSAPDAEDASATGLTPAEPARPRFRMAAWRA